VLMDEPGHQPYADKARDKKRENNTF